LYNNLAIQLYVLNFYLFIIFPYMFYGFGVLGMMKKVG